MKNKANESEAEEVATQEFITKEPLYKMYKDGNGHEIKVANMAHPGVCNRTRIVEIECIKKSNLNEPRFSESVAYDPEFGIYFGVPIGINRHTKEITWQRFTVNDRRIYDCKRHQDAVEWAVISRASWLEGSPYQRGKVRFRVFDKDKEAQEVILKSTLLRQAMEIVDKNISIDDQMDIFRNLGGRSPEGYSATMLQAEIIKLAQRNPKEFVDSWNNNNRGPVTTFNRCIATGLVQFILDKGGYVWKDGLALGMTDQAAVQYMIANKSLLATMDMESKEKDTSSKKMKGGMSNAERAFFKPDEVEEDPELITLRMEAKLYGVLNFNDLSKGELEKAIDAATK